MLYDETIDLQKNHQIESNFEPQTLCAKPFMYELFRVRMPNRIIFVH